MSALLELEGVDGGYGEMQVLFDVSMRLEAGEIVCLIGPNGAGKSTVIKTVFGMLEPWSGTVRFRDRELNGLEPADIVRLGIGYVPQTENVFGTLTVAENLRMGGVSVDADLDPIIRELYDRFPFLADKRAAKARELSGGQRQVLALARALMTDPDLLLVDEPSAGLAPNTAEAVFDDIVTVNDMGAAVMMVEQNATAGLGIADRGYVLDQGQVRFEDAADRLLADDQVIELYLGG